MAFAAVGTQAVVVGRHDLVERGIGALLRIAGVVIDHVHRHMQADFMQGLHHGTEFLDAHGSVESAAALGMVGTTQPVSFTLEKSKLGSKWTWVRPARCSASRWRMPFE